MIGQQQNQMHTTTDTHSYEQENIPKDWEWWSNFLQREYYGGPQEQEGWEAAARSVAQSIELIPGMRILDLGSGCGEMILRLALMGAEAVGVEQSAPLVEYCRQAARERGLMAQFVTSDMFEYQPDAPFDIVLSLNTSFGYGSDEQNRALLAKIGSWLAPGGALYLDVITADNAEEFGVWSDRLAGGRFIVDNSYDREEHIMTSYPAWISPDEETIYTATNPEIVRLYTRDEIEGMMREAGLKPQRLLRAMGRGYKQTDEEMVTTWLARKM
jgi:cyclopropane fatty-acyl-phospholipid synthase-like methyltransferase